LRKNFFEEQQILNKNIVFSKESFFSIFPKIGRVQIRKKRFFGGQQILNQGQGVFEDKFSSVSFEEMAESSLEKHGRVPVFLEEQRKIQRKTGVQSSSLEKNWCSRCFYV
jgi:hypothetical protein